MPLLTSTVVCCLLCLLREPATGGLPIQWRKNTWICIICAPFFGGGKQRKLFHRVHNFLSLSPYVNLLYDSIKISLQKVNKPKQFMKVLNSHCLRNNMGTNLKTLKYIYWTLVNCWQLWYFAGFVLTYYEKRKSLTRYSRLKA